MTVFRCRDSFLMDIEGEQVIVSEGILAEGDDPRVLARPSAWEETEGDSPGGSQPGARVRRIFNFQEATGDGTYTATLDIEAHGTIANIFLVSRNGPWDASQADINITDTNDGLASIDLTNEVNGVYSWGGDTGSIAGSLEANGGLGGDFDNSYEIPDARAVSLAVVVDPDTGQGATTSGMPMAEQLTGKPGIIYDNADTITLALTITDGGTTGQLQVYIDGHGLGGDAMYTDVPLTPAP